MEHKKISKDTISPKSDSLRRLLKDSKILTAEEEVELIQRIHNGDEGALNKLIESNRKFVMSIANQYSWSTKHAIVVEDLVAVGLSGLQEAARRFDETRGFRFLTYAEWWIRKSILEVIKNHSRFIRLPSQKNGLYITINRVISNFEQEYNREPSVKEISYILDEDEDAIISVLNASVYTVPFDSPSASSKGNDDFTIADTYADKDVDLEKDVHISFIKDEISRALPSLPPYESAVIRGSFGIGCDMMTIEDIADDLGMSVNDVQNHKDSAIRRLRKKCSYLEAYLDK